MFGKYQKKCVVRVFILTTLLTTNHYPQSETNQNFSINGYTFDSTNQQYNRGIRLQGIGDFFFKNKAYAKAVPYYQQALEFLPTEADITFKLAEVYQYEKLWRLATLYYEETITLLQSKENFSKSQLNSYISNIRIAYIFHLRGETEQAIEQINKLRKEKSLLISLYPEAWEELKQFDTIYPETAVRKELTNN